MHSIAFVHAPSSGVESDSSDDVEGVTSGNDSADVNDTDSANSVEAAYRVDGADGVDNADLGANMDHSDSVIWENNVERSDTTDNVGPADVANDVTFRRARTGDVRAIGSIVHDYAQQSILLDKEWVTLYENIQEFQVALAPDGSVIGCGALHVLWEDLAEVRTLAVAQQWRNQRVGHRLLDSLLRQAHDVGVSRVFCLTFEVNFFAQHGFREIQEIPVRPEVFDLMRRSTDEGVAEFLDLAWVKPNTLGNTRMICDLPTLPALPPAL